MIADKKFSTVMPYTLDFLFVHFQGLLLERKPEEAAALLHEIYQVVAALFSYEQVFISFRRPCFAML